MINYRKLAEQYDNHVGDERIFTTVGPSIADRGSMNRDKFLEIVRWKSAVQESKEHNLPLFVLSSFSLWCAHIDHSARLRLADTVEGQWQKEIQTEQLFHTYVGRN